MNVISGGFDPRFQEIAERFSAEAESLPGTGASLAIYQNGERVLSLTRGDYELESHSLIFSCSKAISSLVMGMLFQDGLIDFDAPVAESWPEFARVSSSLTIAELMQHKSGLAAPRKSLTISEATNHGALIETLLNQEPLWGPGEGYAYHAITFGTLLNEVVIRATGQTIGEFLRKRVSGPLAASVHLGDFPSEKKLLALQTPPGSSPLVDDNWSVRALTLGQAFRPAELTSPGLGFNHPILKEVEMPGVNVMGNAEALAKVFSATVAKTHGVRLLTDATLERMTRIEIDEPSVWNEVPWLRRGLGFTLNTPGFREHLSDQSFGHDGFGGQVVFADPRHDLSFAFVTNLLQQDETEHGRWQPLVQMLREILN